MISILITLVVVGVVIWLIQTYIPLPPPIKVVLTVLLVLFLCIWLLQSTGVISGGHNILERL
jgi:uncharacterized membrane protein